MAETRLDPSTLPASLGGQFKRHLPAYVFGTLLLAFFQIALNRIDWLSKAAIDGIFGAHPEMVTRPAVIIFLLAVTSFFARVGSRWFIFNAGRDAEYELRALLLHRLHRLGTAFYRTMSAGEIMSRSTGDLQQVRLLLGFGILNIVNVVFAFASALQVMVNVSLRLTAVSFVMLPFMFYATRNFSKQMFSRMRANQESLGRLSDVLQTNLAGVRIVRSFALEKRERGRFDKANNDYLEASLSLARLRGIMMPMVGAAASLGVLAFFWYGAALITKPIEQGGISRGAFFAFWLAYGRMTWPMIALGFSIGIIQRGRAGYVRLEQVLRAEPEILDGPLPKPSEVRGEIRVNHLTFAYGDRKVVDDVSFKVSAGKSIAIVGKTGSGKSTIAMLLARLLPTPENAVFVDGNDVCELPLAAVRENVGYAQQDAFLFSTTVSRNVGFSLDECESEGSTARIRDAAREAQVLEEALGLPEQFDTVVGERGVQLSGGQKQRIALARALVREPKVLVLDDPLSAVDAKTEAAILDAIERQAAHRTVILVTHRVAAASRCDDIIVLDDGKMIEHGTHDELVANGKLYAAFAREQSAKSELEDLAKIEVEPRVRMSAPENKPAKPGEKGKPAELGSKGKTVRDFHEEVQLGAAYDGLMLKRLWPFMRPHALYLFASLLMILLAAGLTLVRPLVMGKVIGGAQGSSPDSLFKYGLMLSGIVIGTQALSFVQMYTMQIAGARSMADLRAKVFEFLQSLELRYYDKTPVGRLVTRATNDVDAVGELFASGVLNAVGDLVALLGIVIMMLILDARMSLIAFAALPFVAAIVVFVRSRARQAFRDIRVKTARLNAFLNEQVSGMPVVQAYARETVMAGEFDEINVEYRDANKKSIFYEATLDASIEMVGTVCIASVLWWSGLKRVDDPTITFALVVTFTQYIKQFFEPVSMLAQRYTVLQSAMSGAERIFKLLDEPAVEAPPKPLAMDTKVGAADEAIAIEDVTFAYKPGVPVLKDISLHVKRGEKIALVGATGAGKTTVTSLLLRLYDFDKGTVRVLGKDVHAYDRRELREQFSVVPQDVFLFAGTVASNIAMTDGTPDLKKVEGALSRIGALDVFMKRPGGLEARVDERGANYSAGERQLIAFARALYRDAPLLILDEATASIDSDTEHHLQAALEAVVEGRTSLVIAHRLSTIRAVDRIVVFHKGRIVESGTHDELLAKEGIYARLYRFQFAVEQAEIAEKAPLGAVGE